MNVLRKTLLSLALLAGLSCTGCGILLDAACDAAFSSSHEEKHVETVEVVECHRCHHRHSGSCTTTYVVEETRPVTTTRTVYVVERR